MTANAQPIALNKIPREGKEESQFQIVLRRFMRHRLAVASLIVIILMVIAALLAPYISPFPRDAIDIAVSSWPARHGRQRGAGAPAWR